MQAEARPHRDPAAGARGLPVAGTCRPSRTRRVRGRRLRSAAAAWKTPREHRPLPRPSWRSPRQRREAPRPRRAAPVGVVGHDDLDLGRVAKARRREARRRWRAPPSTARPGRPRGAPRARGCRRRGRRAGASRAAIRCLRDRRRRPDRRRSRASRGAGRRATGPSRRRSATARSPSTEKSDVAGRSLPGRHLRPEELEPPVAPAHRGRRARLGEAGARDVVRAERRDVEPAGGSRSEVDADLFVRDLPVLAPLHVGDAQGRGVRDRLRRRDRPASQS